MTLTNFTKYCLISLLLRSLMVAQNVALTYDKVTDNNPLRYDKWNTSRDDSCISFYEKLNRLPHTISGRRTCMCMDHHNSLDIKCNLQNENSSWFGSIISNLSLNILDLSHSKLEQNFENYLSFVQSVKRLILRHCHLTSVPTSLITVNGLQEMDVSNNIIRYATLSNGRQDITQSKVLSKITHLNLSHNYMEDISISLLHSTPFLRNIDLSHNRLPEISPKLFSSQVPQLVTLNLSYNELNILPRNIFYNLQHLRHLDLSFNKMTAQSIGNVKHENTDNKKHCEKHCEKVEHVTFGNLLFPGHLTHLYMQQCLLQQVDFCQISKLHDIQLLDLSHNPLPCDCHVMDLYTWFR